jgi:betaine-aldehyde dehydrogenase
MQHPELRTWIAGVAEPSEIVDGQMLLDPNTGGQLQASRTSSPEQLERAIAAADEAHRDGRWRALSADERAAVLDRFADELRELGDDIACADAINSGVPISVTRGFAEGIVEVVTDVAERLRRRGDSVRLQAGDREVIKTRVPWGPAALILPWNAPAFMVTKKLAYALAAGATTVIKPSSFSPWSAQLVVAAAHRAGFPAGSVNLVTGSGSIGRTLVSDARIRAISMTGSTSTGQSIAASAGAHLTRLQLELGSNNPAIVLADADLELAAAQLVSGVTKLSGQWCEAPRRVYAHRDIFRPLVDALTKRVDALRVGSSLDDATEVGPLAYPARVAELSAQLAALEAQGATVHRAKIDALDGASFFAPTLAFGESLHLADEVFGPLLTVVPYDNEQQAIELANSGSHGLAAYVFTADAARGREVGFLFDAGEVKVNGTSVLDMADGSAQGFFAMSGIGGHGDDDVLEFFTGWRIVGSDADNLPI